MESQQHASSNECAVSALDLFSVPPTQTSVTKGTWVDIHPLASVTDSGPIEFEFEGKRQEFLDLAHTLLYVKAQVLKLDGSAITDAEKVGPVNLFLHSLFTQLDITLNGRSISDGTNTYPYRAYLETLLSYGTEAKSTHLTASLFYKDTAGKMDEPDPTKTGNNVNQGLKKRTSFIKESSTVDLIGRVHGDIFNQEKFMLDGVKVRMKLHRSRNHFSLMSAELNPVYKVKINETTLKVRKVEISSPTYLGILGALKTSTAKYPIKRSMIKIHTISAGTMSKNLDNVFRGRIPERIVVGIVDNDAFNGAYKKNPFNFQNYKLTSCGLIKNNEPLPGRPYQTNFPDDGPGEFITAFQSLLTDIGGGCYDHGNTISRDEYASGYTLISFDTSPDLCQKTYLDPVTEGDIRLELQFGEALAQTVNVIIYAEFDQLIEINENREILHDFST